MWLVSGNSVTETVPGALRLSSNASSRVKWARSDPPRLLELLNSHDDGVQICKVLVLSLFLLCLPELHLLAASGPRRHGVRHASRGSLSPLARYINISWKIASRHRDRPQEATTALLFTFSVHWCSTLCARSARGPRPGLAGCTGTRQFCLLVNYFSHQRHFPSPPGPGTFNAEALEGSRVRETGLAATGATRLRAVTSVSSLRGAGDILGPRWRRSRTMPSPP